MKPRRFAVWAKPCTAKKKSFLGQAIQKLTSQGFIYRATDKDEATLSLALNVNSWRNREVMISKPLSNGLVHGKETGIWLLDEDVLSEGEGLLPNNPELGILIRGRLPKESPAMGLRFVMVYGKLPEAAAKLLEERDIDVLDLQDKEAIAKVAKRLAIQQ